MNFHSLQFAAFLALVVTAFWTLRGRQRLWLLLGASYFFYGYWDYRFLVLLWISTIVDFLVGRRLGTENNQATRKWLLASSLATNLGILGFFKYFNFFTDSAAQLLTNFGLEANPVFLEIILPVGISFYTFQTMAYSIDVYRGRLEPCQDPVTFGVFVAFFPQLVAGPIERARQLLPQLTHNRRRPNVDMMLSGVSLIVLGLFRKVVLADLAAPAVANAFDGGEISAVAVLGGTLAFAIQIYGDFSGYTNIARGSARMLGIELVRNFEQPYLSRTPTEFWRRWHISLSTWLRDYVYVPLGGNRRGHRRTYVNLMLTMVLGGFWHGAEYTFIVWGVLNGLYLVVDKVRLRGAEPVMGPLRIPRDLVGIMVTFGLVCVSWVFFRAASVGDAFRMFEAVLTVRPGDVPVELALIPILAVATLVIDLVERSGVTAVTFARRAPAACGVVCGLLLFAVLIASGGTSTPFIYFQF